MIRDSSVMKRAAALLGAACLGALSSPALAAPGDKARVTGFVDIAFGTLTGADQSSSQSVCAFSNSATSGYSVTATGNGTGGAFTLAGASPLPYEVRWAGTANQANGTALTAGVLSSGFTSAATQQACSSGPGPTATLTVTIRAAALGSARAGSYTGSLQITIAPE
ncbi:MAG: hypothetical protein J2O44_05075 [Porphyrobacter sp.]|nr:hypothetical protein [Porphyrobacter sp.]